MALGIQVTQLRTAIINKVGKEESLKEEDKESSLEDSKKVIQRLYKEKQVSIRKKEELSYEAFKELVPEGSRKK